MTAQPQILLVVKGNYENLLGYPFSMSGTKRHIIDPAIQANLGDIIQVTDFDDENNALLVRGIKLENRLVLLSMSSNGANSTVRTAYWGENVYYFPRIEMTQVMKDSEEIHTSADINQNGTIVTYHLSLVRKTWEPLVLEVLEEASIWKVFCDLALGDLPPYGLNLWRLWANGPRPYYNSQVKTLQDHIDVYQSYYNNDLAPIMGRWSWFCYQVQNAQLLNDKIKEYLYKDGNPNHMKALNPLKERLLQCFEDRSQLNVESIRLFLIANADFLVYPEVSFNK